MEDKDKARREAMYAPLRAYMEERKNWTPEQKAQHEEKLKRTIQMFYPWTKDDTEQK